MRSRTEMVTTKIEGSDFEEDSDFEDSEEDWQPAKDDPKGKGKGIAKLKGGAVAGGSGTGRRGSAAATNKNGNKRTKKMATGSGRGRKRKEEEEEDIEDDLSDDEEADDVPPVTPAKKPRQSKKNDAASASGGETSEGTKQRSIQRKATTPPSTVDKNGFLKLYAFKGDLKEGIKDNEKVCLWRRDGSSLLQKYLRDKTTASEANTAPQFTSSMVYSCWEDKRSDEYLEIKVRCLEQQKQVRVQLVDVDQLDKKAREEYVTHVEKHGEPKPRPVKKNGEDEAEPEDEEDVGDEGEEEEDEDADGMDGEESEEEEEE